MSGVEAAGEEAKPLDYIPEVILKKRKKRDELAFLRKKQLELGNFGKKKQKVSNIKRPEDFVLEFRAKELDNIRLKQRMKRLKSSPPKLKSDLLFIIRIQGKNDMHPRTKKVLYSLGLRSVFTGVFAKASDAVLRKLLKVQPYVTYGYPNLKSVRELIFKKGYAKVDGNPVPLTDNTIIEQALGKHGIISIEDLVHEISNVGQHFREVMKFLGPLKLNKPERDCLHGRKQVFSEGGDTGNREEQINDLISKMN
ncbi:PREDICTED: 60S ribosomal protein L7-1-like [Tarenaya hassleriana]|uniref:60S ribosomal protein L7-1-like n=1 Tax=Tarenaya hassleriana TaxID=28532 RepID=UPI00053C1355|nr:PREDICTED: 60S ribosomal protein L7-1-like [Tarenaya hassleriana]XP_010532088.1 PREDICTED: 60S ribosomal protein L7-1-like [Tarenaya hassleriana]